MTVLFLITDLHLGGSPLVVYALARGLAAGGRFRPVVVSVKPLAGAAVAGMLRETGIVVHGLNVSGAGDLWRGVKAYGRVLERERPAVVQSVLVHANLVAVLGQAWAGVKGLPRPVLLQGVHTVQARPAWHWWLGGVLAGFGEAVVAPSVQVHEKLGPFAGAYQRVVVPNGVDVERFAAALPMEGVRQSSREFVIGCVGRLDPVKRFDLVLEAVARLVRAGGVGGSGGAGSGRVRVVFVGYGAERGRLERLAGALGIGGQVTFAGPQAAVERWYKSFDVMCLPSVAEGFGLAVVEAMAAGVPVVVADTALNRALTGGHATFFQALSADALAVVLQRVIAERPGWGALEAGREHVRTVYSEPAMIGKYQQILQEFLRDRAPL